MTDRLATKAPVIPLDADQSPLAAVGAEKEPPTSDTHWYEIVSPASGSGHLPSPQERIVPAWSMIDGVAVTLDIVGGLLFGTSVHRSSPTPTTMTSCSAVPGHPAGKPSPLEYGRSPLLTAHWTGV